MTLFHVSGSTHILAPMSLPNSNWPSAVPSTQVRLLIFLRAVRLAQDATVRPNNVHSRWSSRRAYLQRRILQTSCRILQNVCRWPATKKHAATAGTRSPVEFTARIGAMTFAVHSYLPGQSASPEACHRARNTSRNRGRQAARQQQKLLQKSVVFCLLFHVLGVWGPPGGLLEPSWNRVPKK